MIALINHWRVAALIGLCLAGLSLYLTGKQDGRQDAITGQLREAVKIEKERAKDDAKLRSLSDYDFCALALRRRGLPVEQCNELRGVSQ